jgi:hypothetical protein
MHRAGNLVGWKFVAEAGGWNKIETGHFEFHRRAEQINDDR